MRAIFVGVAMLFSLIAAVKPTTAQSFSVGVGRHINLAGDEEAPGTDLHRGMGVAIEGYARGVFSGDNRRSIGIRVLRHWASSIPSGRQGSNLETDYTLTGFMVALQQSFPGDEGGAILIGFGGGLAFYSADGPNYGGDVDFIDAPDMMGIIQPSVQVVAPMRGRLSILLGIYPTALISDGKTYPFDEWGIQLYAGIFVDDKKRDSEEQPNS